MGSSNESYSRGKSPITEFLNNQFLEVEKGNNMSYDNSTNPFCSPDEESQASQPTNIDEEQSEKDTEQSEEEVGQLCSLEEVAAMETPKDNWPVNLCSPEETAEIDGEEDDDTDDTDILDDDEEEHSAASSEEDTATAEDEEEQDDNPHQTEETSAELKVFDIPIDKIVLWEDRLRKSTSEQSIEELANTIKRHGLMHPVTVKETKDGKYFLISGFRRYLAYKSLRYKTIPATISWKNPTLVSLIENTHREDLSALQRAEGLLRLKEEHNYRRIKDIARLIGKAESTVSEILSLNNFPDTIKKIIRADRRYTLRRLKELVKEPKDKMWEEFLKYQDELGITHSEEKKIDKPARTKKNLKEICEDEKERKKRIEATFNLLKVYENNSLLIQEDRVKLYAICFDTLRLLNYKNLANKLFHDCLAGKTSEDDEYGEFSLP